MPPRRGNRGAGHARLYATSYGSGYSSATGNGPALRQARIDDDRTDAIMISAIDALRDIHPSA